MIRPDKVKTAGKLRNEGKNMFWRILKRDMKRKKTMNTILLLFILLASLFLASSVSNLITMAGLVNHYIEMSGVPDLLMMAEVQGEEDEVLDFIRESEYVQNYETDETLGIENEQVEILFRKDETSAEKRNYEMSNTLTIQAVPKLYTKVFDADGEPLELSEGEIALTKLEAEKNDLQEGDRLAITVGDVRREFTVVAETKDAVFGTSFMGFKRNIISQADFDAFMDQENMSCTRLYYVNCSDRKAFQADFAAQGINTGWTQSLGIEKELVPMCYVFDMLTIGIMVIVSICLILISFLVLSFTITFTMQEEYKEIGIMKAIGLKDKDVGGIYLIKYLALSVAGAVVGCVLSFPFGSFLLKQAVINIVVDEQGQNPLIHIAASAFVVVLVFGFCIRSMGKLKKISALQAIRGGQTGESYAKKQMKLSGRRHAGVPGFLALNDVLHQKRRFLALLLCFIIGTIVLLLPLSAKTTLESEDIVYSFGMWKSDLYLKSGQENTWIFMGEEGITEAEKYLEEVTKALAEEKIEAQTGIACYYGLYVYAQDENEIYDLYSSWQTGEWEQHLLMLDGREPVHENEIAITERSAQEMGVSIGDTIYVKYAERNVPYLITGTYQTLMNMGEGLWFPKAAEPDAEKLAGFSACQVALENPEQQDQAAGVLRRTYPNCTVYQGTEALDETFGLDGIIAIVESAEMIILLVVLGINILLTMLFVRTFLTKERGDVALMKSMGFRNGAIMRWQAGRILLVLAASVIIGAVLARVLAPVTLGKIFAMMGATRMELKTDPLLSYVICPLLMFAATGMAALLSMGGIRRVDIREVNSIE